VLGLFVVGRLARRHGLSVRLGHTDPRGVTAVIGIPHRLLAQARLGAPGLSGRIRPLPPRHRAELALVDALFGGFGPDAANPFPWFGAGPPGSPGQPAGKETPQRRPAVRAGVRPPPPVPEVTTSAGLVASLPAKRSTSQEDLGPSELARRVPGTHLTPAGRLAPQPPVTVAPAGCGERPRRDPEAERDVLNDYLSGFAKAADPDEPTRSNLAERHS